MNSDQQLQQPYLYRDIVLLYCPSKVGSTTIATSVRLSAPDDFFVFHSHGNYIAKIIMGNTQNSVTVDTVIANANFPNKYTHGITKRKIYIIDIYRPTIEKRISEYFQDLAEKHFNNYEERINESYSVEKIIKRFNDIFPQMVHTDYYREIYDIPVEEKNRAFDIEKKYQQYESNGVTYIKLRLKDSDEWSNILTTILGKQIYIVNDYASQNKKIGTLYKKFNFEYKLPYNFYRMIELCPQLQFYYNETERNEYLNKWQNRITDCYTPFNASEYQLYNRICEENRVLFKNLNNHYADDGCMCDNCSYKRKELFELVKNGVSLPYKINHPYDDKYNNSILLKMQNTNGNSFEHVLNVINY